MGDLPKKSIRITDLTRVDTPAKIDAKQELLFPAACNQEEKDTFAMPLNTLVAWLLLKHAADRSLSNLDEIGQAILDAKQDYFNKVTQNTDLNSFTTDGIWKVKLTGVVECHAPGSGTGYYVVAVDTDEDGVIEQQARNLYTNSGDIYHRQRINGTWTGWGLITQDMGSPTFTDAPHVVNPGTADDQLATIGQLNIKFSDIFQTEWRITEGLFVNGTLSYADGVFTMNASAKYYTNDSIKVETAQDVTMNIASNVTRYVFADGSGQLQAWSAFEKVVEFPLVMTAGKLYYNIYTDQYADVDGFYSLAPLGVVENGVWSQRDGIQFLNVDNLKTVLDALNVNEKVDKRIGTELQNSVVTSDDQYSRQISAGHYVQTGEEYELDFGAGIVAQSHEEDEDTEGQYNKAPEATVFAQDGAVRTEINVTPQGAILNTPRLDAPSEIATMADLDEIVQTSLTFVGYVSTTQPSSSDFTFKIGNIWINSATMPTTFPVPASSIRVWNGTSWETTTNTYTASDFDFVRNMNDNEGYYWFGGVWKIMSTDMDTDYFELGSDGKWKIKTSVNLPGSPTTTTQLGNDDSTKIATTAFVQTLARSKSTVSVSETGTSTNEVKYITVDGTEYKLVGGSSSDGANTDLSNLTSVGQNIGNWSSNVTNCITEIPQNIKLELNNGVLTLKAGSKVYVPNGFESDNTTPHFDELIIENDRILTSSSPNVTPYILSVDFLGQHILARPKSECSSGTTPPTSQVINWWYDTANNLIKEYVNGSWSGGKIALPIAEISYVGNNTAQVKSIDQVFNGFGYIGSTVFALPGVKGLIPDGRNNDGTLKNTTFTVNSVLTNTGTGTANKVAIRLKADEIATGDLTYDEINNYNRHTSSGEIRTYAIIGYISRTSGVINSLSTKTVFHAVDYSDTEYMAHQAMPSDRYMDLTLGASGSTYTAPADGYVGLGKSVNVANQYVDIFYSSSGVHAKGYGNNNGDWATAVLPVSKGQSYTIQYNAGGQTRYFKFVYAQGAQ